MAAAKYWTKIDPKDAKIILPTNYLSKLDENQTSVLATFQEGGGNINQTHTNTNTKVRHPNKSYVEGLNRIESCRVTKSKDNVTRDGQDWCWFPKHNMKCKFDVMYINHPANKHDERVEEKQRKREA